MDTDTLPIPSPERLSEFWMLAGACPSWHDRCHQLRALLYEELGLDWRNPDHKSHVWAVAATIAGKPPKWEKWATNN